MRSLQSMYLCLALTAIFTLRASAQRNRYPNNNNNNQNSGSQSGQFGSEDNPHPEENQMDIPCPVSASGAPALSCIWKHQLPTTGNSGYSDTRHISCGSNPSVKCSGSQTIKQSYLTSHTVGFNIQPCSIHVDRAHPDDTGDWECHLVTDDGSSAGPKAQVGTVEVFVSNKSEIYITEPDLNRVDSIQYDLGKSSDRIEATCTGYGGSPIPTFHWFVDDDDRSNEIQDGDGDASIRHNEYNDRNGRRAESTITFQPSLQTLCDLNLDDACDGDDFNGLNFNLICTVEQQGFPKYNDGTQAKVMVEVSSANQLNLSSFVTRWLLAVLLGLAFRWQS